MNCTNLYRRDGNEREMLPEEACQGRLGVVAADLSTNSKAVLPDMAGLYWPAPSTVSPAHFVRASMSIPFFFHPMRVTDVPRRSEAAIRNWADMAGYTGDLPEEVLFADGGIISNFPIDLSIRPICQGVLRSASNWVSSGLSRLSSPSLHRFSVHSLTQRDRQPTTGSCVATPITVTW